MAELKRPELEEMEASIARLERIVWRQHRIVADLEADGSEAIAKLARSLLRELSYGLPGATGFVSDPAKMVDAARGSMDDREHTVRALAQAEHHVLLGEKHIAAQHKIISELEAYGHLKDAERARELLKIFKETQALHVADRDRHRLELGID